MSFTLTSAYIGPYGYMITQGNADESQHFRFPIQSAFNAQFGQAQMVLEGRLAVTWSGGSQEGIELDAGAGFVFDARARPVPAIDEEMTIRAMTNCVYLCVVASGIAKELEIERHQLSTNESVSVQRYSLVAIAGHDATVCINDGEVRRGTRLIYANSGELTISSLSPCVIGVFSLRE